MKIALYARVSKADLSQNPENQLMRLRDYAQGREWEIYHEYVDQASGSDSKRPQLENMLADARGNRFKLVLTVRLDRIGRSILGARSIFNLITELEMHGVRFECTDQPISTNNPHGRLILAILGGVADFERELIRDRTKAGLARAKAQGKRLGRPPNPARTEEIIRLRDEGLSLRQISQRVGISHQGVKQRLRRERLQKGATGGK